MLSTALIMMLFGRFGRDIAEKDKCDDARKTCNQRRPALQLAIRHISYASNAYSDERHCEHNREHRKATSAHLQLASRMSLA